MTLNNARKKDLKWDIYLRIRDLVEYDDVAPNYSEDDREYVRACAYRVGKLFNIDRYLIK